MSKKKKRKNLSEIFGIFCLIRLWLSFLFNLTGLLFMILLCLLIFVGFFKNYFCVNICVSVPVFLIPILWLFFSSCVFAFILSYLTSLFSNVYFLMRRERKCVELDRWGDREDLGEIAETETTIRTKIFI